MIQLQSEQLLSLQQAAELLPGTPALSTLHRWRQLGVRGVKLETCLIGGKRYTSTQALQRFTDAVTAAVDGVNREKGGSRQVCESNDDVSRQLDYLGLK